MFGSAALVWVLIVGSPVGYFKTKEACIEGFRQAVVVFDASSDASVRPLSGQANATAAGVCVPVEVPIK